jgi:hypothetical protein
MNEPPWIVTEGRSGPATLAPCSTTRASVLGIDIKIISLGSTYIFFRRIKIKKYTRLGEGETELMDSSVDSGLVRLGLARLVRGLSYFMYYVLGRRHLQLYLSGHEEMKYWPATYSGKKKKNLIFISLFLHICIIVVDPGESPLVGSRVGV